MRLLTALSIVVVLAVAGCAGGDDPSGATRSGGDPAQAPLRIGTKNFTEQFVLGELYRQALEAKGFPVELKVNVGSSEIIHEALTGGALDMYPEYLGVLLSEVANERARPSSPRAAYAAATVFEERNGFTLLGMTPFSDANALAVTPEFARDEGVRAIADLGRVRGIVRIGAPPEFRTRFEGLIGLNQRYGLRNVRAIPMTIGEQYEALAQGRVDVAAVFTTAGQLAQGRYVLLRDPRELFGTQHVAPVISRRAVQRFGPGLSATIDAVSRRLTATAMRRMNAAVDLDGRKPDAVADEFLREQALK